MFKKIIRGLVLAIGVLVVVVLARTFTPGIDQDVGTIYDFAPDQARVSQLMTGAVQHKTISYGRDKPTSGAALLAFHDYLAKQFPRVHRNLKREVVNQYSLLYTWTGSDAAADKAELPVLLLGHLDVVPVIPGTEEEWKYPPYEGVVAEGYIWGRGTLDNKVNIVGILEAAENMLAAGISAQADNLFCLWP